MKSVLKTGPVANTGLRSVKIKDWAQVNLRVRVRGQGQGEVHFREKVNSN